MTMIDAPRTEEARVTTIELFFDLVFVFTLTQLTGAPGRRAVPDGGAAGRAHLHGGVLAAAAAALAIVAVGVYVSAAAQLLAGAAAGDADHDRARRRPTRDPAVVTVRGGSSASEPVGILTT